MDVDGDDFVVVRSKRQKRPTIKQKQLEDSEESEADGFIPPLKNNKSQSKSREKGSALEVTTQHAKDSNSTRSSIDETIFNRNTALAMALSANTAPIHDTSLCSNPPQQSQQVGGASSDDSDDYQSESQPSESESDDDFEPSPKKPKKLLKPKTARSVVQVVAEKVNVQQRKVDGSTVKSVIATCPRDLPGTKPSTTSPCGTKPTTSPRALPGTKPSGSTTSPCGTKPSTSPPALPGTKPSRDVPRTGTKPLPGIGTKSVIGRRSVSNTGTPVKGGNARASRPKWTPPGPAKVGKDASTVPQAKSCPNAPAIRVGLSRRAPIKPLHTQPSPLQTKN